MSSGAHYQDRRITNWSEYNRALTNRGSLTFWLGEDLPELWFNREPKAPGSRGLHRTFSDQAIQICLTIKAVFHLAYRQTEGFVNSVFALGGIGLKAPDYTALAKRAKHLEVAIPVLRRDEPVHAVVDSTGLKVYGEGEWKVRKHGMGKRRTWRKLHLAVDAEHHEILGVELTCLETADCEVLPTLLEQCADQPLATVAADGAYDTRDTYRQAHARGAAAVVPPRSGAAFWASGHPRNAAVEACRTQGRSAWKRAVGYHRRSNAETAMFRYKQILGPCLSARLPDTQITEAYVGVSVLNRINRLGMPKRASKG
jgi:hypothetical protein